MGLIYSTVTEKLDHAIYFSNAPGTFENKNLITGKWFKIENVICISIVADVLVGYFFWPANVLVGHASGRNKSNCKATQLSTDIRAVTTFLLLFFYYYFYTFIYSFFFNHVII